MLLRSNAEECRCRAIVVNPFASTLTIRLAINCTKYNAFARTSDYQRNVSIVYSRERTIFREMEGNLVAKGLSGRIFDTRATNTSMLIRRCSCINVGKNGK